jgi:ankyrin repeat protein
LNARVDDALGVDVDVVDDDVADGKLTTNIPAILFATMTEEKSLFDENLTADDVHALVALHGRDVVNTARDKKTRFTPIMHPSHSPDVVRALLQHGADVNYVAKRGLTPLMTCRSAESARVMLAAGARVDAFDAARFTALLHSVDDVDKLTVLLDAGADVNWRAKRHSAMSLGSRRWPVVQLLLSRGATVADVYTYEDQDRQYFAPLHVAGTPEWVDALLRAGASIEAPDHENNTPLMRASNVEVVRALLRAGANPNAKNVYGRTPLFRAYTPEWVKVLIDAGADARLAVDSKRRTPIMTVQPSAAMFRALVDAGVDINAIDAYRLPILRYNHIMPLRHLRSLVELGANFDHPFVLNDHARHLQSLLFLIACGVDIPEHHSTWLLTDSAEVMFAAGCRTVVHDQAPSADSPAMVRGRQRIQRARLDLIREEASIVCIALQSMELPAWVTLQIIDCVCAPFAVCVPLFLKWNLITCVKHFRNGGSSGSLPSAAAPTL